MNQDFPKDRESFRQEYGYDFPYSSDEELPTIDNHHGNPRQKASGIFNTSLKSSGTGSDLIIAEHPVRLPGSKDNLVKEASSSGRYNQQEGRRFSELTSSYQSDCPGGSIDSEGGRGDFMDELFETYDKASDVSPVVDQIPIGENVRRGSKKNFFSGEKSVADKSMAESTFFFGNLSTSDEGTDRKSRERINIPLQLVPPQNNDGEGVQTFPQNSDIDLKMMVDDKSVRSALTCDRSYAIEETFRKLYDDIESTSRPDEKTDSSVSAALDGSDKNDSMRKSTCSSHHGSFMAWPDSDGEIESSEEEIENKEVNREDEELNESLRKLPKSGGDIVCEFPTDRSAFRGRGSFQSTSSHQSNSKTSCESRKSSGSSGSSRKGSRKSRRASLRASLETIDSNKSKNSFRNSLRKSISDRSANGDLRDSLQRSVIPRRKSLTELHDASSSALPIVGWDDSQSDSSSLVSSSSKKRRSSVRKPLSSSLSSTNQDESSFYGEWMTRSSFRRSVPTSEDDKNTDTTISMQIDEEVNARKPWMKASADTMPQPRRESNMSINSLALDQSITSAMSLDKSFSAKGTEKVPPQISKEDKESKGLRSSVTSVTSSLADDQSISSDLTELKQAQEALFSVREDDLDENDKEGEYEEEQEVKGNELELAPTIVKPVRDTTSSVPFNALEAVEEEPDEPDQDLCATALETVEEESDVELAANDEQSKLLRPSFLRPKPGLLDFQLSIRGPSQQTSLIASSMPSFIRPKNGVLDELGAEIPVTQPAVRSPNENDSDTYSDVDVATEKNSSPTLGHFMSVHDHDIEQAFNTTEMEDIDFKDHTKEAGLDETSDLGLLLEGQTSNKSREDHSSHKTGKSGSRSGLSSLKVISDKWRPIKDRVKKKSGSNHVRRRNKRLWKFCVWNCRKITVLVILILCVIVGIAISSWYGASKNNETNGTNEFAIDEQGTDENLVGIQWPPVGETGRNPIEVGSPTSSPSIKTPSVLQSGVSDSMNSSSPSLLLNQSSIPSNQNLSIQPSMISSSLSPKPTVSNNDLSLTSFSPVFMNATSQDPSSYVNATFDSQTGISNASMSPSLYISSFAPQAAPSTTTITPSVFGPPLSNATKYPSSMPTYRNISSPPSPFTTTMLPTLHPNISIYQSLQLIHGEDEFQYTGSSVSITPSGEFIVVGMKEAYETGMVRVFKNKRGRFSPLGKDSMFGDSPGDEFGSSVSISDDGKHVAVGARSSSSARGKNKNGAVKIYQYSSSLDTWLQIGSTIKGSGDFERLGFDVGISSDGKRVACGSPKGSNGFGNTKIYDFNRRKGWQLVGDVLVGQGMKDMAGFSVSLSSDGSIVAVGAISASLEGLNRCGGVTIYNFDSSSLEWKQYGQVIAGLMDNAQFGYSIALSGNGKRIAIGSKGYSTSEQTNVGSCEVFELDIQTSQWEQIGAVFGSDNNEEAGHHVSMSENGKWIACSKTVFSANIPEGSVVVAREESNKEWAVLDSISFDSSTSYGTSSFLSRDGEHIIIGAPAFNSSRGFVEFLSIEN